MTIYIIDDEKNICRSLEIILRPKKHRTRSFGTAEDGLQAIQEAAPDIVFLDVMLPGMDGLEALVEIKKTAPETDVVMISGHANLSMAVEATRSGAYDFLEKPLHKDIVLLTLRNLVERRSLSTRLETLEASTNEHYQLVGESPQLTTVKQQIGKVAPTDSKVLVTGESGVGKELVAYAIHNESPRKSGPFIKMNCAAIPEELTESELFGNEKGAFTGASDRRDGKFLQADNGTLFLDEIGDMSLKVQTKVLRVLQDGEIQRVGGKEVIKVDVRIVAATNKNLEEMVSEGSFREDLYFRLNVLPIYVPPLRERAGDVVMLAQHFIEGYCQRNNFRAPEVVAGVYKRLSAYHWPGNVRELQNVIERLIILCENNQITEADLPPQLLKPAAKSTSATPGTKSLQEVREAAEKIYIEECLAVAEGNVSQAARLLGVERTSLHKKMKALGIK